MAIIEIKDLKKVYRTFKRGHTFWDAIKSIFKRKYVYNKALKGINFKVNEGEIVGLIGPNGAGKSTTIKILSGILYPTSGEAKVMGYIPYKQREKYVENIGVVFGQKSNLFWDIPALDSFWLSKYTYKIPTEVFLKRLNKMVKFLKVESVIKRPVRDLSLGERMKCELISSVLHHPKIWILDEPTIGIDILAKEKIHNFIKELNRKEKITVILTTHDMSDIEKLCKRVVIINKGKIVYDGNLWKLRKSFMNNKRIYVKFSKEKTKFKLKGTKIEERGEEHIRVVVDLNKAKITKVINQLMKCYDVVDIDVEEPKVEDVIKKIYRGEK